MNEREKIRLIEYAVEARKNSYSPYSNFKVGASVLTDGGEIFTGCNIENSSYTPTVCAERVAIFKAVSEGHKKFTAIAVVCEPKEQFCFPCGVCRQVMAEFFDDDTIILLSNPQKEYKELHLSDLLPYRFNKNSLK